MLWNMLFKLIHWVNILQIMIFGDVSSSHMCKGFPFFFSFPFFSAMLKLSIHNISKLVYDLVCRHTTIMLLHYQISLPPYTWVVKKKFKLQIVMGSYVSCYANLRSWYARTQQQHTSSTTMKVVKLLQRMIEWKKA